jgi:hypothetical protein
MPQDASFIPPHITPPDPIESKVVAFFFSTFMAVLMISLIGVVCIDFIAEMVDSPINFGTPPSLSPDIPSFDEQEISEGLKSPFELITPKHQTLMKGSEIFVLYTRRLPDDSSSPPELLIDDSQHPWNEQFGDNTWLARLQLQAGLHLVQVEESKAEFFVETEDSPLRSLEKWAWNRPHPDTDKTNRCFDCHERGDQQTNPFATDRNQAIGAWKGIANCFVCHDAEEHEIRHAPLQSQTIQCLRCHMMH